MSAIDTLRDALFGNPPTPTKEPSREGLLSAFSQLYDAAVIAQYAAAAGITIVSDLAARDTFYATEANRGKLVYVNNNAGSATDPANGVYEYVGGSPRFAQGYYEGVATITGPEFAAIRQEIAALDLGKRLPALTTDGAAYYGVYSTARLVDGVGPLVELTDGQQGPPQAFGAREEAVPDIAARAVRGSNSAARVRRVFDQLGSARHLTQTDPAKQPAMVEAVDIGGSPAILIDGRRSYLANPARRGLDISGWSLDARDNTRFLVFEPTLSIAPQLYERWANSGTSGDTSRNLFTSSSDTPPFNPDQGGKLRYNGVASAHLPTSPQVIAIREVATQTDLWFDDVQVNYGGAGPAGTLTTGFLGYGPESGLERFSSTARLAAYVAVDGALSNADVAAVIASLRARFATDLEAAPRLVLIGDSILEGVEATLTRNVGYYLRDLLAHPCRTFNLGLSGNAQAWSYNNRSIFEADLYRADRPCVAVIESGINDIHSLGRTGSDLYTTTTTPYIAALKAMGYRVAICTLLPQTASNVAFAEPQRVAYNDLVRANAAGADAIIDQAADPIMGVYPTAPNDPTLYPDGIHPSSRGYAYLAPIWAAAINPLLI